MSQRVVEVQKLSSILEAKLCTKIRAKRWQAFMKSLNLYLLQYSLYLFNTVPNLSLVKVMNCHNLHFWIFVLAFTINSGIKTI